MAKSKKYNFNRDDFYAWSINVVRFVFIPTAIAFLGSYSLNLDIKVAYGVAVGTLYTSVVDFVRKFVNGK